MNLTAVRAARYPERWGGKPAAPGCDSGGRALRYDAAMFARQYPVVVFFVQHIAYYRGLHSQFAEVAAHRDFWRSTCDAHLKVATISWCNVFGSSNEELHWRKTPAAEVADQAAQDLRQRILAHTGFTSETWQAYHKSMLDFRNKYVAHLDILTPFFEPVPDFDPAIQTAFAYQEWVRDLTRPALLNQPALSAQYAGWEREACSVIGTFMKDALQLPPPNKAMELTAGSHPLRSPRQLTASVRAQRHRGARRHYA